MKIQNEANKSAINISNSNIKSKKHKIDYKTPNKLLTMTEGILYSFTCS